MTDIAAKLGTNRVVPVVAIENAEQAVPLAEALLAGGLACAEITFRTAAAADAIRAVSGVPGMLVGAGTVLSVEQAKQAVDCGATFLVTPGFNREVVRWCGENGVAVAPGCATPTDLQMAHDMGLDAVKFFPAEAMGGMKMLKALAAPYTAMRFIPTGGVSAANLGDYLAFPRVIACGGSWMVKKDLIAAGDWARITTLAREAVQIAAAAS
jgi:2-dehydro-3-deoxyphosphogluconate aldolase/(4S)-4-hydroxy-2-oxoglutarate aldolase